jgi:Gpi18-like mannosyltransferase
MMDNSIFKRIQNISQTAKLAILIFIVTKIIVFVVGFVAFYQNAGVAPSSITELFNRWDAPHYIDIAKDWYVSDPSLDAYNFIAFFPLYPILIRMFALNLNYINLSALIVANVCSVIVFLYLYKLAKLEFNEGIAVKAVLFLSIFPTAYFFSAPYTESLFFALTIASIYYARLGKWSFAGTLSIFATLTRIYGLILVPALIIEYYHQKGWKPKKTDFKLIWTTLASVGFLIYLAINKHVTGAFFTFMEIQRRHWYNTFDPLLGLSRAYGWANSNNYPDNVVIGIAPIAFAIFGLIMVGISVWKRLRPVYITYMFFTWVLAVSTSMWISVPRYIMAMFPMFMLFGLLSTKRKIVALTIIIVSVALLCYFTGVFAWGWFAF